jgi:predicted aspartyl protease
MKHISAAGARLLAVLLVAMLPGCAPSVTVDMSHAMTVWAPGCSFLHFADVKLQRRGKSWAVPATIDGNYLSLTLDTGASHTVIGTTAAKAMNLPPADRPILDVSIGLGGIVATHPVKTGHFEVAGIDMADQLVGLAPLPPDLAAMPPVLGLLGNDYLGAFDIEIDPAHDRLGLYGSKHCDQGYLPWSPPYEMLPMSRDPEDDILLDVVLDGTPLQALLDTGSSVTVLTRKGASAMNLSRAALDKDRAVSVGTADGNGIEMRRHRFGRLAVGPVIWSDAEIGVQTSRPGLTSKLPTSGAADLDPTDELQPAMILGVDFLRRYKIWISYAHNQVFLAPITPPPS